MPLLQRIGEPIGASGSELIGNQVWRSDEYNVDLNTPQNAVAIFDRMRKSDAQVRASLNNLLYTLLSLEWRIDAAKDDPQGEKIADHVRSVLMPGETYGYSGLSTWQDTLRNALSAVWAGFSVLEKVKAYRPRDGKQIIGAFEPRLARSIRNWDVTPKGPSRLESVTQVVQMRDGRSETRTIPADRCVVLTLNREGDNFWGESILRPAHFHWRRKKDLLKFDAIQKERMGGIFWVTVKEGMTATPAQIAAAKLVLQNFRIHESQGLYFPSCFELHCIFPTGEGSGFIDSAEYDDRMIERAMFSGFQSLGTGDKGALSVGEVQLDFMLLAYQAVVKWVEDGFGTQAIEDEVNTNFGEREFYPRLAGENLLQMKPDRLATSLGPLIEKGAVRIDRPLRVYFRSKFALPEEDEKTLEPVPGQPQPALGPGSQQDTPGGDPGGNQDPAGAAAKRARGRDTTTDLRKFVTTPRPLRRDPLPHEVHAAFSDMSLYLDQEPDRIWARAVKDIRADQIKDLAKDAAAASEAQLPNLQAPRMKELGAALRDALLEVYTQGRRSVLEEAIRQRDGKGGPVKKGLMSRIGMALRKATGTAEDDEEDDPIYASFSPDATKDEASWITRLAQGLAVIITATLLKEAVRAGQEAQDQELEAADAEFHVRHALLDPEKGGRVSEAVAQNEVVGTVVQTFTTARKEQIQKMGPAIEAVYYSAIMDDGTCSPCASMDGAELDPDTWSSQVPNRSCDWPPHCRCQAIPVFQDQALRAAA